MAGDDIAMPRPENLEATPGWTSYSSLGKTPRVSISLSERYPVLFRIDMKPLTEYTAVGAQWRGKFEFYLDSLLVPADEVANPI